MKYFLSSRQNEQYVADTYTVLSAIVDIIHEVGKRASDENLWMDCYSAMTPSFFDYFLKVDCNAIKVANLYECFIVPANGNTAKKLTMGFEVGYSKETGSISINKNKKPIGMIGEKSDLIWSAFFQYFVVTDDDGYTHHTLPDHEEILSLQLFDVASLTATEIDNLVKQVLLEVAVKHGMQFKIYQPNNLWREVGIAGNYSVDIPDREYEYIPCSYLSYGLGQEDERICYLHLFQVLEYFFIRARNKEFKNYLHTLSPGELDTIDDYSLNTALKHYNHTQSEAVALKLVIKACIDPNWLRQYISSAPMRIQQYTTNTFDETKIVINLEANDEKLISRIADRIYFFRCSIAHSKGDAGEFVALPSLGKGEISKEIPLLREIAYKALSYWSK